MVIVMKKRTVTAAVICFLCVIALGIKTYEHNSQNAAALNVSEKVIIIDAGHGGEDGGAVGGDGTPEKELNLAVALKLQALLEQQGCTVFMTRSEDISLSTEEDNAKRQRKIADLNNRKNMVEKYGVDAFVSIHMNTFPDKKYFGAQVFYAKSPEDSKRLASCIQEEINDVDKENTRVAKDGTAGIYVLQDVLVPSVVVECGFLSNEKDLQRLKTDTYRTKLAIAVFNGITKYFSR